MSNGSDKGLLVIFGLLAVGGFFYARKQWWQNTGGGKATYVPPSGPAVAATFALPEDGPGGTTQTLTMSGGTKVIVTGSELPSAGQFWSAAEDSDIVSVDVTRQSQEVGKSSVQFDVIALSPGTATVIFTLINPQGDIVRSWNLDLTVE